MPRHFDKGMCQLQKSSATTSSRRELHIYSDWRCTPYWGRVLQQDSGYFTIEKCRTRKKPHMNTPMFAMATNLQEREFSFVCLAALFVDLLSSQKTWVRCSKRLYLESPGLRIYLQRCMIPRRPSRSARAADSGNRICIMLVFIFAYKHNMITSPIRLVESKASQQIACKWSFVSMSLQIPRIAFITWILFTSCSLVLAKRSLDASLRMNGLVPSTGWCSGFGKGVAAVFWWCFWKNAVCCLASGWACSCLVKVSIAVRNHLPGLLLPKPA